MRRRPRTFSRRVALGGAATSGALLVGAAATGNLDTLAAGAQALGNEVSAGLSKVATATAKTAEEIQPPKPFNPIGKFLATKDNGTPREYPDGSLILNEIPSVYEAEFRSPRTQSGIRPSGLQSADEVTIRIGRPAMTAPEHPKVLQAQDIKTDKVVPVAGQAPDFVATHNAYHVRFRAEEHDRIDQWYRLGDETPIDPATGQPAPEGQEAYIYKNQVVVKKPVPPRPIPANR